jgi:hypothetical protein
VKIPDYISPIVAARVWKWDAEGLKSFNDGVPWLPEQPMKARCSRPLGEVYKPETCECEDNAPAENCTCGIYAAKNYQHLVTIGYASKGFIGVQGEVYLWGKILEHELGYRAQYAYPKNLTISVERFGIKRPPLQTLITYGVDVFLLHDESCERMLVWSQEVGFNPRALECVAEKRPYKNQYKCLYGNKGCGESAVYCEPCNRKYEQFLLILNNDDR